MKTLDPKRRAAAVCAVCASIIPSTSIFMLDHPHSSSMQFTGGLVVGIACAISFATIIRTRKRC